MRKIMTTTTEYIEYPVNNETTNHEFLEHHSKTTASKTKKVQCVLKVYDYKEESKRLIRELNEMVAKWK